MKADEYVNATNVLVIAGFNNETIPKNNILLDMTEKIAKDVVDLIDDCDAEDIEVRVRTSKDTSRISFESDLSHIQQYEIIINENDIGRVQASEIEKIVISKIADLDYNLKTTKIKIQDSKNKRIG